MDAIVAELRKCSESLLSIADELSSKMETPKAPEEKQISLEEVRAVLARKASEGLSPAVKALLEKYGGKKLSDIKREDYGHLIKEAEAIGNAS